LSAEKASQKNVCSRVNLARPAYKQTIFRAKIYKGSAIAGLFFALKMPTKNPLKNASFPFVRRFACYSLAVEPCCVGNIREAFFSKIRG